ncbi:MAG: GDP-mannose mannosyl hydrolase [Alteromonadaceae bacterium]|nr:GDP-mannose mannosyl hydrolase [Alteromonadaceae bacterium]
MFLPPDTFKTVIESTPLVSIDLIVRNNLGEVLLGLRTNSPAQHYWFVPGGRIQKNETMAEAFSRLCEAELGLKKRISDAQFLGPYEHFYEDSVFAKTVSTHYVVLGFEFIADIELSELPSCQHVDYQWFPPVSIKTDVNIHNHIKWYFEGINRHLLS